MRFLDEVVIVTGATSGIGEATARLFCEEGAYVVLGARSVSRGEALVRELGTKARFVATDIRDPSQIEELIDGARREFGRVDVLFNNAGAMGRGAGISELTVEDFDDQMDLLVRSVFVGMRCVAPIMQSQQSGSVINNASIAGTRAGRGTLLYSTAKAAVLHMTRCVAMELGESGIRVNAISPGFVATPMMAGVSDSAQELPAATLAAIEGQLAALTPLRRSGQPLDVAEVVVFLASAAARFVNGQEIVVDGGASNGELWSDQARTLTGNTSASRSGRA